MRRGLAALVLLAALSIPTAAQAKAPAPAEKCDVTDPAVCLFPWPNDAFTVRDKSTETERRLALDPTSTPRNKDGVFIDPTDINRADGFSPGSSMLTKVPGRDTPAAAEATGLPRLANLWQGVSPWSPVVVINARTGKRQPIWAELDSNAADAASRVLIIRPARNLQEGERYIVALRNLKRADGSKIPPSAAFRAFRDRIRSKDPQVKRRRHHFERIFKTLRKAGVGRNNLYLAWDFTVASEHSLAGRALHL